MYIKVFYSVSQHCFFVSCVSACVFIIRVGGAKNQISHCKTGGLFRVAVPCSLSGVYMSERAFTRKRTPFV